MTAEVHEFHRPRGTALPATINIEAEQGVLGAALLFNELIEPLASILCPEHFSEEIHKRIFDIATQLFRAGKPASPITLRTYLGDADLGGGVTIPRYLARIAAEAAPPLVVPAMAREVRDLSARRDLVGVGTRLIDVARDARPDMSCADVAASVMLELQEIAASAAPDTTRSAEDVAGELMTLVEGVRDGTIAKRMITTGYADLDRAMNGYVPGTLVIVAGRPGMGKTIFANSSGYRCAKTGVGVLQFPLEVGPEQLVARHLADIAYFGPGSPAFRDIGTRAAELDERQVSAVRSAYSHFRDLPIAIDSRSRVTLPQLAAKVAQTKRAMEARGVDLGVVIVDHLDFIAASDRYSGNRTQEIGEIALGLKDVARSQNVCVVLLSQLSREVERRGAKDRRPTLADLRNSGDLEQVADVVAFLYREEYYLSRSAEVLASDIDAMAARDAVRGKLEIILGKTRAGPTTTMHLWCDAASSSISSFERGRW